MEWRTKRKNTEKKLNKGTKVRAATTVATKLLQLINAAGRKLDSTNSFNVSPSRAFTLSREKLRGKFLITYTTIGHARTIFYVCACLPRYIYSKLL